MDDLRKLADDCVHCGFCLPACPTYQLWGQEMDSPRGRIHLMTQIAEGAPLTDSTVEHFDRCLGCMACMPACPSGVRYDRLIEITRTRVEVEHPRTPAERALRAAIFAVFPFPRRLRALRGPLRAYQRTGLDRLIRRSGLLERLSPTLAAAHQLAPPLGAPRRLPARVPARGRRRAVVGMLTGCIQREFFPRVNTATARVLAAEGCDVIIPPGQGCCGALSLHTGRTAEARSFARATIETFERAAVDAIVVNSAGCGSAMKEYGELFAARATAQDAGRATTQQAGRAREGVGEVVHVSSPASGDLADAGFADGGDRSGDWTARAASLSAKVRDLAEFLIELFDAEDGPAAVRHPLPVAVAYHDACHLAHAQGVRAQPRALLRAIPGLDVIEVPDGETCCGSAGVYNLLQPETARELGDRKAGRVRATGASLLVTANPGCSLQIATALRRQGHDIAIAHTAQVLDASIRGLPVAALTRTSP